MAVKHSREVIEQHLKTKHFAQALPLLLRRYGVFVDVHRIVSEPDVPQATTDKYSKVFGVFGNTAVAQEAEDPDDTDPGPNAAFSARILLPSASFAVSDQLFASDFESHYIYTDAKLLPGDRFTVTREDGVAHSWKILEEDTLGLTSKVFGRFKIGAIVDDSNHG